MSESNWALAINGAAIADVSHEAVHVSSSAANLLSDREDQLWITGEAPQHVTLQLDSAHPPLNYAGWHVWHDYVTNPKRVEIASGESRVTMTPLLMCQALPGAGTQVWRLPRSIPPHHRYVRFTIVETFGPGPTYVNNVVLLEADPGVEYLGSAPCRAPVPAAMPAPSPALPVETFTPSPAQLADPPRTTGSSVAAVGGGYRSRTPPAQTFSAEPPVRTSSLASASAGVGYGGSGSSAGYVASRVPASASASSAALLSPRQTPRARRSTADPNVTSDGDGVGVFPRPVRVGEGGGGSSIGSGRMSQLLRDLDEDIRSLRPIRSVSPTKNMLLYVPQDPPQLLTTAAEAAGVDEGGGDGRARGGRTHRTHDSPSSSRSSHGQERSGSHSSGSGPHHHHRRRGKDRGGGVDSHSPPHGQRGGGRTPGSSHQPQSHPSQSPAPPVGESAAVVYVQGGGGGSSTSALERVSALEQAVASLTQTVQHQREDITMMKRLLLQQATERRARVEQERAENEEARAAADEWRRRYEREHRARAAAEAHSRSLVTAPPPAPPVVPAGSAGLGPEGVHLPLSRSRVEVEFPEDALRGFVQAVLDEKLTRRLRKSEARVLGRLDDYLHDVVASIADGVDERVRWHLARTGAGVAAPPLSSNGSPPLGVPQAPPPARRHPPVPVVSIDQTAMSSSSGGGGGGGDWRGSTAHSPDRTPPYNGRPGSAEMKSGPAGGGRPLAPPRHIYEYRR